MGPVASPACDCRYRARRRADAPRTFPDGFRRDRGSGAFRFPAGAADSPVRRITTGWEHYRGQLGGVWEVWRGKAASDNVTWDAVAIPHCFNAWDAVDPDHAYGVADDQGLGQNVEQLLLHFARRLKYPGIELKLIARG